MINGRYYIGKHKTSNLNDGYLGSGALLKKAIKRYGKENFVKYTLHVLATELEMDDKEREIVNKTVVAEPSSYNLRIGGVGGFSRDESLKGSRISHASGIFQTTEYKEKRSKSLKGRVPSNKGKPMGEATRCKLQGLVRSDNFKRKVSLGVKNSERCKGNIKPRFTYSIKCPDGSIKTTIHLKRWCKEEPGLSGINDQRRMNARGYFILSKVKFSKHSW